MSTASKPPQSDPFRVLGLSSEASEEEIRGRYLQLVKQFPPEREPERFREIQAAYESAKDPLALARKLLEPPNDEARPWSEVIAEQAAQPPRLSVDLLLSLGNRDDSAAKPNETNTPEV